MQHIPQQPDFVRPLGVPVAGLLLETLEYQRDRLEHRLIKITREEPGVCDGFVYTDLDRAEHARGHLTASILAALRAVNGEIRGLIAVAPLSPRLTVACAQAKGRRAPRTIAGAVMRVVGR